MGTFASFSIQWRHNEREGVSNHQPYDCLLNRLFRRRSKKITKFSFDDVIMWHRVGTASWIFGKNINHISSPVRLVKIWERLLSSMYIRHVFTSFSQNRRAANPPKVPYLRSLIHPPTHLVCNTHLIANFLSFHMSFVVVMNCGAGNVLYSFEIRMF